MPTSTADTRAVPHVALAALSPGPCMPQVDGWQLTELIGTGSLATVYAARPATASSDAECDYAIKLLRSGHAGDSLALQAFAAEARLGKLVSHPNLVPVLAAHTRGDRPHLVLPRLHGATARAALQACGPLEVPHALWVARQIAQALSAVHQAGWLHGDVKPDNVMLSAQGHCTLFDLGFAQPTDRHAIVTPDALRGTLAYLAPERLVSRVTVHPASDIYSLGITLFELLTGQLPFDVQSEARWIEAHLRDVPMSPRNFLPSLPHDVARLVHQTLSKMPDRRPNADELIHELERLEVATFSYRHHH